MTGLDPLLLARIQFAANISFHILFPSITIALGWLVLYFKLRFLRSGQPHWLDAYYFFVKVFALSFALGVVSGVTMSFQFGTNWPGFMETVGNIAGPLLAYEVLTAFFLEASFLGIMLFGRRRVGERIHTLATVLVALGTTFSAFWILALNSWMQTPAGFEMVDGRAQATDWWAIVFNPSFPYRFAHMLLASGLTASFLVAGLSAYRWLRGDRGADVLAALRTGVMSAALLIPVQIFVGDLHGLNTFEHQPAKAGRTGRAPAAVRPARRRGPAQRLRHRHPETGQPDPDSRSGRRDPRPGFLPWRTPAGGTSVLGLPADGRCRPADAAGVLVDRLALAPPGGADPRPGPGPAGHELLRLGGDPGRLVRHRDRPPALAGHRRTAPTRRPPICCFTRSCWRPTCRCCSIWPGAPAGPTLRRRRQG
jgi:hypothetical protein